LTILRGHEAAVGDPAMSPDGRTIASASTRQEVAKLRGRTS
jgi:hypothetical protein